MCKVVRLRKMCKDIFYTIVSIRRFLKFNHLIMWFVEHFFKKLEVIQACPQQITWSCGWFSIRCSHSSSSHPFCIPPSSTTPSPRHPRCHLVQSDVDVLTCHINLNMRPHPYNDNTGTFPPWQPHQDDKWGGAQDVDALEPQVCSFFLVFLSLLIDELSYQ